MSKDLNKDTLYEAVKTLVEFDESSHIHLSQAKLFTLYSIAFQYMLYNSTKEPGAYIIRIEDSQLADKLARKAKDSASRKFLQKLLLPRKLKYKSSTFYLDFFHVGTWNLTKDIPPSRLRGAIIIKNTSSKPMHDLSMNEDEVDPNDMVMLNLPKDYFYSSLKPVCPKVIAISLGETFEGLTELEFDFIKEEKRKTMSGVTLSDDLDWDKF